MSLRIKISKQSVASAAESRPAKRRIQRIESDDEDEEAMVAERSSYDPPARSSRRKKARHASREAAAGSEDDDYVEGDMDVDVDIDGDIEDTRFLPEPHHGTSRSISPAPAKRRLSNAAASSSKARGKEAKSSKSKTSSKKPRRQVVWTDDEDDDFDDPEVVVTDDDDFDPEPDYSSSKKGAKGKVGKAIVGKPSAKSKGGREKDEKEIIFRDERRLPTTASDPSRRPKAHDDVPVSSAFAVDLMDEASLPKKRKLPTIKNNKPSTAGSTAPSTPSAPKPLPAVVEKSQTSRTPAPTSNQVGTRKPAGASADINLLDSSVYSELFKSTQPGVSTPNSGLNRKQKEEERRKELNRMRDEARAKRNADTKNAFDLQASPEKIERFVLHRLRHSTARFPNVLGATFKEMHDRTRVPVSTSASVSTPALAGEQR